MLLNLALLNFRLSFFEKIVDPDQMASVKPSDQDPHCFPLNLRIHAYNSIRMVQVNRIKIGGSVVPKIFSMTRVKNC